MSYTASVTRRSPTAAKIAPGIGMLFGTVDITSYHATLVAITGITNYFKDTTNVAVIPGGLTDNGYALQWVAASKAFKAYYPTNAVTPAGSVAAPTFTGTANAGTSGTVKDDDNAATLGHAIYVIPAAAQMFVPPALATEASAGGLIKHSATAAADGVLIYVVVDDPNLDSTYQLGHFEFVSPTNANGTCTIKSGGATLNLFDDDAAATNGVVVRAVAAGAGLEATTGASKDILVPVSNGRYIHVNHATTGSTPSIYFDEDAANTFDRLQAVVVDTADEPYSLFVDNAATENPGFGMVQGAPGRLATFVTSGPKPFTYLVGASGSEVTIGSRPDAASLPAAVALYVQAAGAGFNAANFGKEDLYVPVANGEFIKVAYAASPAGVQVYSYPEAATGDLAFQGVIVDNANETYTTEAALGWKRDTPAGSNSAPAFTGTPVAAAAGTEVANAVDVGAVSFIAVGIV